MEIGIAGTFDVQNLGDLLFPIVAEAELSRRIGPINLHRFSYGEKNPPEWPYRVESVAALPQRAADLDAMLIGGGHLIRFDKAVAPGYGPPSPDIHHPTGYWLMPALLALQNGCPVIWNAVETWREVPDWAAPLLRAALENSSYVAVRHEHSRDDLLPFANGVPVEVVPDTCFGIGRIVDPTRPSDRYLKLRRAAGLRPPYIVIQATPHQAGFVRFLRQHRARFTGYQFVSVPIGPALGDHDGALAELEDMRDAALMARSDGSGRGDRRRKRRGGHQPAPCDHRDGVRPSGIPAGQHRGRENTRRSRNTRPCTRSATTARSSRAGSMRGWIGAASGRNCRRRSARSRPTGTRSRRASRRRATRPHAVCSTCSRSSCPGSGGADAALARDRISAQTALRPEPDRHAARPSRRRVDVRSQRHCPGARGEKHMSGEVPSLRRHAEHRPAQRRHRGA